MLRIFWLVTLLTTLTFLAACGGTVPANNASANSNVMLDNSNLPAGMSTSPVQPGVTPTPGIPASPMNIPKGATPTPGIPSPEELKKPMKPGVTPTPGIPSPEEIRRQLGQQPKDGRPPADSPADTPTMKKNTNKLPRKP